MIEGGKKNIKNSLKKYDAKFVQSMQCYLTFTEISFRFLNNCLVNTVRNQV